MLQIKAFKVFFLNSWLSNTSISVPQRISSNRIKGYEHSAKVYMIKRISGCIFLCSQGYGKTEEEGEC